MLNPAGSASIASVSNAGNKTAKIQFNSNFISGTIKAIASNACGTSPSFNTFAITAAPPTPGPISLNPVSPYCSNIIPKATIAAVAGTTEYQWSTVSTTTPVIQFSKFANGSSVVNSLKTTSPEAYLVLPTTSVSISKTIKVKAKNTCGTCGGRQATITINSCQAKPLYSHLI